MDGLGDRKGWLVGGVRAVNDSADRTGVLGEGSAPYWCLEKWLLLPQSLTTVF